MNGYQNTRWDHLVQGGASRDRDAALVVGNHSAVFDTGFFLDLSPDFLDHLESGLADGLHGHGGEGVGEHGPDDEAREDEWVGDDDRLLAEGEFKVRAVGVGRPGDKRAKQKVPDLGFHF